MIHAVSIVAAIGAWVAGLGIIFAAVSFCFGILRPRLLRWGLNYLLVTDVGLIVMLAALLYLLNNLTLQIFSAIGIVALVALTVAAFIVVRTRTGDIPVPAKVLETTRRRVEF